MKHQDEILKYFIKKLDLHIHLPETARIHFFIAISSYLGHSRTGNSTGRTLGTIQEHLDRLCLFLDNIGCTPEEKIKIIQESPDLLNTDVQKTYEKYLLLAVIPECELDPYFRKNMMVEKPRDFRVSIDTLYARYMFAINAGYPPQNLNWSMLLHDTNSEFAKKFVKNRYKKEYKILASTSDYNQESINSLFPYNNEIIEEFKSYPANLEIVSKMEGAPKLV